jgi:hypothetical protein
MGLTVVAVAVLAVLASNLLPVGVVSLAVMRRIRMVLVVVPVLVLTAQTPHWVIPAALVVLVLPLFQLTGQQHLLVNLVAVFTTTLAVVVEEEILLAVLAVSVVAVLGLLVEALQQPAPLIPVAVAVALKMVTALTVAPV